MYIRRDPECDKYAVTYEEEEEPKSLEEQYLSVYWFPTLKAATLFANAQKRSRVIVENSLLVNISDEDL